MAACLLSIRWAVDQFNSESVLFRESERLDLGLWLRHLLRDRQPTPTVAAAVCCGVLILVINFFMSFSLTMPDGFGGFARTVLITQLAVIAAPALLMTVPADQQPAANAAAEVAAVADDSRRGAAGRRAAPGGQPPADRSCSSSTR